MTRTRVIATLLACGLTWGVSTIHAGGPPEPLLRWTFDEATSGDQDALDTGLAPAENGLFMGGATRTTDTPGGASAAAADLLIDAEGYVQATETTNLQGLEAITITAWVNLQADPASEGSGNDRIASIQGDGDTGFAGFSFNINTPNAGDYSADNFRLGMFIGGDFQFDFAFSDADVTGLGGEWVFLSTTVDTNAFDDNLVYYTGTETAAVSQLGSSFTIDPGAILPVAANFYIGNTDGTATSTSIEGYMDDVRVYDSALSLAELEAIRLVGVTLPPLQADFDVDGDVDGDDFLAWQGGFPTASGATKADGDYDNDGDVDGDDFLGWQGEFPSPGNGGGSSSVPEPAAILLLLSCLCGASFCRR